MNDGGFEAWLDEFSNNAAWEDGFDAVNVTKKKLCEQGARAAWAKAQDAPRYVMYKGLMITEPNAQQMFWAAEDYEKQCHVLKQQADKLAETLEYLITAPDHQCFSEAKLRAAKVLKEYRNEK